jgi:hypothetical protein
MFTGGYLSFRAPMTRSPESARVAPDPDGPLLGSARPRVGRDAFQTTDATRASLAWQLGSIAHKRNDRSE